MSARSNQPVAVTRQRRRAGCQRLLAAMSTLESRRLLATFTVDPSQDEVGANFHSITGALTAANSSGDPSDTITVAANTSFTEDLVIDKPVALIGAQATHDARSTRTGGESTLNGQIAIASTGVSIDGFTILNGSAGASTPTISAIYVTAPDAVITNNIITGATAGTGILAASADLGATLGVNHNLVTGWATGVDAHMPGTVTIDQNKFDANGVGISVRGSTTTATLSANAITHSTVAGITADLLTDAGNSAVSISGSTLDNAGVPQLRLDGGTDGEDTVTLSGNVVTLAPDSMFVSLATPTPVAGRSANTFNVLRSTAEEVSLDIDLSIIDGTNIASLNTTGLTGTAFATNSVVAFNPATNFNGTTSFGFTTDGDGVNAATGTVSVLVTPVNDAPTSFTIPTQSLLEEATISLPLAFFFSDADVGDTLGYSIGATPPAFLSLNSQTGVLTIAPHTGDRGSYSVTATASDGQASASRTFTITVVRAVNQAPVFGNLPSSVSLAENAIVPVYDVDATDPDNDALTYSIVGGNSAGRFAIDATTGVVTLTQALDAEQAQSYTLAIRATDNGDPAFASTDANLVVNVTDVDDVPTVVTLNGDTTAIQGQVVNYVATAVDSDIFSALTLRWLVDGVVQAGQTSTTFSTSFSYIGNHVVRFEASDRGATPAVASIGLNVGDAPPTIPVSTSVDTVDEGVSFNLTIGTITDANPADVAMIGQVSIEWGDGQYLVINSSTDPATLDAIRNGSPVSIPHTYDDGQNVGKMISVHVHDTAGHTFTAWAPIVVNNVAPTGSFTAVTPSIMQGASAIVNWFGQTDVSTADVSAGLRYTFAIDVNGNGALDSGDTLISGDGTYAGSGALSQVVIPGAMLTATGIYKILGLLIDKDNSPVLTSTTDIVVTTGVLRVVSLGGDHSGFTVNFNRAVERSTVNLWDGTDVPVDTPDIVLTRANGSVISGSLIWNSTGTGFDFLTTGGILSAGNYTVTIRSGASAFHATDGSALDGDDNGSAGGTYSQIFGVNAPPGPVFSFPDFARGPGQPIDVIPGTTNSDLPVTMNSPIVISSLNFQIRYSTALMTVENVYAGAGLPPGWDVAYSLAPNAINVSLTKTTPTAVNIPAGQRELIKIQATVPNDAALYGQSEILTFAAMVVNGNASLEGIADRAVHKVVYLGDANFDGNINAADAALMQSVVLKNVTGFDTYPLIDPVIVADSSRSGGLVDAQDATNAALSGFTGGRPTDVPAFTPLSLPGNLGSDPTFALADHFYALPGTNISVPINVPDNANGVQAGAIRVSYDPSVLTLNGTPVLAGSLLDAGWQILTNVNANEGWIEIAFYSGVALARATPAIGTLLSLQFAVAANAPQGISPLTVSTPNNTSTSPTIFYDRAGSILTTAAISGSVVIDTVAPTASAPVFDFAGTRQTVSVVFSEDVSASIATSKFELKNLNTNAIVELVVDSISGDGKTVTFRFANTGGVTNALLTDGNYRFRVLPNVIADPAGNVFAAGTQAEFFFQNGDANHDKSVNFNDLVILAQNYNQPSGNTFATGDLNYDGHVDFNDLVILAQRYNQTLADPPPQLVAAPAIGVGKKRTGVIGREGIV